MATKKGSKKASKKVSKRPAAKKSSKHKPAGKALCDPVLTVAVHYTPKKK